eukprot:403336863
MLDLTAADGYDELFPYVLIVMALICGECMLHGPFVTGRSRKRTFTQEFMSQFEIDHAKAIDNTKIINGGYPDSGSGVYSQQLTYKQWFDFNNAIRVHMNYVEQLPLFMTIIFLAGIKLPLPTLILSGLYFVTRFLYTLGYVCAGPNLRQIGAAPNNLIKYGLFGMSFYTVACFLDHYRYA